MIHEHDTDYYEALVRSLENENRALRETLRDKFVAAAVTGLTSYGWGPDELLVERAFKISQLMIEARKNQRNSPSQNTAVSPTTSRIRAAKNSRNGAH